MLTAEEAGRAAAGEPGLLDRRPEVTPILLVTISLFGVAFRVPGLTRGDLSFADAWFALPARVGFSTALSMTSTAPGAQLLQRSWTRLDPTATWFAQSWPLLLGCLAPALLFLLGRALGRSRWAALVMAACLAAAPGAVVFAIHVDAFSLELVVAISLLLGAEIVRRRTTWPTIVGMVVLSGVATVLAVELAAAVAGCWLALVLLAVVEHRRRGVLLGAAAVVGLLGGATVEVLWSRLPTALAAAWRRSNFMVAGPWSTHRFAEDAATAAVGVSHGLLGTPIPRPTKPTGPFFAGSAPGWALGLVVVEVVLLLVVLVPVAQSLRRRDRAVDRRLVVPAVVLLVGLGLWLTGQVPLGTGGADLLWYPPVIALVVAGVERGARWLARWVPSGRPRTVVAVVSALLVGMGAARLAWHERAWYPNQDVAALLRIVSPRLGPHDVIVVTRANSMTWAFAGLSPFQVHHARSAAAASHSGYWVSLSPPHVLVEVPVPTDGATGRPSPAAAARSVPGLRTLPSSTRRIVEIGITGWAADPWAARRWGPTGRRPVWSAASTALSAAGWHATPWVNEATGVFSRVWLRR